MTDFVENDPLADLHVSWAGWDYYTRIDHDDGDVRKIGHYAVKGAGKKWREEVEIPFSPYAIMTSRTFRQIVSLGFPNSISGASLTQRDVEAVWSVEMARATE